MKTIKYFVQFIFLILLSGIYKILGLRLSLTISDFMVMLNVVKKYDEILKKTTAAIWRMAGGLSGMILK